MQEPAPIIEQLTLQPQEESERWKKVADFSNYSVSDQGRVRNDRTGYILRPWKTPKGYSRVELWQNGAGLHCSVHRLVLEAFVGLSADRRETNHKNGTKDDNRLHNLEWVTQSENSLHAYKLGLSVVPNTQNEHNGNCKLSNNDVKQLREMAFMFGVPPKRLAALFGIHRGHVTKILQFKARKKEERHGKEVLHT